MTNLYKLQPWQIKMYLYTFWSITFKEICHLRFDVSDTTVVDISLLECYGGFECTPKSEISSCEVVSMTCFAWVEKGRRHLATWLP